MANLADAPDFPAASATLVKETWKEVVDAGALTDTGYIIYERMFTEHPGMMELFSFAEGKTVTDLKDNRYQQRHTGAVLKAVSKVVDNLDNLAQCYQSVYYMGERHKDFNLDDSHFQAFGDALMHGIKTRLGNNFTDDRQAAMKDFYNDVLVAMTKKGMADD